ncbi:MAG: aspartate/glutamate racemase family protein, partial [Acetobacteraceae bacterium]|nr:aspartate/glutamate racemase family protein [Acetobacteraceae bacterium]
CVVLGGAGLVGLAPRLRPLVPVPVLDCLEATLGEVERTLAAPARKPAPSVGLSAPLAGLLSAA